MVKLVQATKSNAKLILRMMEDFYAIDNYPFEVEKASSNLHEFLENDTLGVLLLVVSDEHTVGYLALTFGFSFEYGGRDAFIDEFFLVEEVRGRGVGSQVMMLLDEEAKTHGVNALHLEVEPHNVKGNRIYQKAGYASNDRSLMTKRIG